MLIENGGKMNMVIVGSHESVIKVSNLQNHIKTNYESYFVGYNKFHVKSVLALNSRKSANKGNQLVGITLSKRR